MHISILGAFAMTVVVAASTDSAANEKDIRSTELWKKLERHVAVMVTAGYERQRAENLAYAAYVKKIGEICGPSIISKADVDTSYRHAIEATRLPARIIEKHQPIFESVIELDLQDDLAVVKFCGD